MTDQRQRFAQQTSTPQRTEVMPQQGWQPAGPPQGSWQPTHPWPHQPQQPQQQQQHWQPQQQHWQPQHFQPQQIAGVPGQPSSEEKNAALGAYIGAFFMPVVLPLLIMLTATNKPFQRAAALQALIMQLGTMVLAMLVPILMFALLFTGDGGRMFISLAYVPVLCICLFSLGFGVMGMVAAQGGKVQYAPLVGRRLARTFRAEWPD